ncbi:cell division protein FtsA [Clostridium swellfunianum]|uniref:cell division protein FtsA n=1 Tax=Clostridium swellfunianum TaxID=1367462 RepID=UPI00202F23D2|nr:cell division protein FtsA [Clostridium swellfunianum]MCM0648754.1 cell division protein FtsA [Clostridium swellfunianum]
MDEYIVGIDIGSSKICGAAGKIDKQGKLQIAGVKSVACSGLKKGIVVDIDSTSEAIRSCIEQLNRMIDKEITNVYISLPGGICELVPSQGVVAISSEDREINKNDVQRVLNAAKVISIPSNKEIIGVIPNEYIIDGFDNIKDPISMSGLKLEVDAHVILAQTTIVSNLIKSVRNSGLSVNGIALEPLVVSQIALKKDELKMGSVLLDIGADKIDISVYKDGDILYTEMIPFGGNTITNDIALCLKIPFSEADNLKLKYGSLEKPSNLAANTIKVSVGYNDIVNVNYSTLIDIIEARVEEYFILIKDSLQHSGHLEDIANVIIVGGGVSYFKGICELGRNVFNIPVRVGVPEYLGASSPVYNTAVGIIRDVTKSSSYAEPVRKSKETTVYREEQQDGRELDSEQTGVLSKIKGFLADFF